MLTHSTVEGNAFREFIADFNAAAILVRRLRRVLAKLAGLKAAEYAVLLGVWYCEREGRLSVKEIADHLHVAATHVTDELGKLERSGFIVKQENEADRRALEVRLTDKGLALFEELKAAFLDVNFTLFENIDEKDLAIVHIFFKRVIAQAPDAIRIAEKHNR